jgi:hypothetical protein
MNFFFLLIVAWAVRVVREYSKSYLKKLIAQWGEWRVLAAGMIVLLGAHIINTGYYTVVAYDFDKVIFEFPLSKISVCNKTESCGWDSYI